METGRFWTSKGVIRNDCELDENRVSNPCGEGLENVMRGRNCNERITLGDQRLQTDLVAILEIRDNIHRAENKNFLQPTSLENEHNIMTYRMRLDLWVSSLYYHGTLFIFAYIKLLRL